MICDLLREAVADPDTHAIERALIEDVPGDHPFVAPETAGGRT
jgi:hypothetical protein